MKLYHFTARHHLDLIRRDGFIREGQFPISLRHRRRRMTGPDGPITVDEPIDMARATWLTRNKAWDAQSWYSGPVDLHDGRICDRLELRIRITIPRKVRDRLFAWHEHFYEAAKFSAQHYGTPPEFWDAFNVPGSEDWFVFSGSIPVGWFRGIDERPESLVLSPPNVAPMP